MVRTRDHFAAGEIVVEVAGPQNNNLVGFTPLAATLRGRWDSKKVPLSPDPDLHPDLVGEVPGMLIAIDLKRRTLRSVDPLGFDENKEMCQRLSEIMSQHLAGVRTQIVAEKETVLKNLTPTELKTALWRMWQLIDSNLAECITDNMPKAADILAMEGNLMIRGDHPVHDWDETGKEKLPRYATEGEVAAINERLATRERVGA